VPSTRQVAKTTEPHFERFSATHRSGAALKQMRLEAKFSGSMIALLFREGVSAARISQIESSADVSPAIFADFKRAIERAKSLAEQQKR
jgi:hypothetical protein